MTKEILYNYFQDANSKNYLNPQIIEELFLKNVPFKDLEKIYEALELTSKNPYITSLFQEIIDELKSLTEKDIFTLNPQDVIDLYHQKHIKGIYRLFGIKNKHLSKKVVDVLFLDNISPEVVSDMIRAFGFNYLNDISQIFDISAKNRIYMRIHNFLKHLENLTDKNIYEISDQELIELYYKKEKIKKASIKPPIINNYNWGIYSLFRNPKTLQYLDKEIVDALFLEPGSKSLENYLVQAFGPNYLFDISKVKDLKEKNRIYMRAYRFRRDLENLFDNVYEMDTKKVIIYFYQNIFHKSFPAKGLINRNYLLPIYQTRILNIPIINELFNQEDINLYSVICLSMGINVDRRLSYNEIAIVLNIQEDEVKNYLYQAQSIFHQASKKQLKQIKRLKKEDA